MHQFFDGIFHFTGARGYRDRGLPPHGDGLVHRQQVGAGPRHKPQDTRQHPRLIMQHEMECYDPVGRRLKKWPDAILIFVIGATGQSCYFRRLACGSRFSGGNRFVCFDHALKHLGQ